MNNKLINALIIFIMSFHYTPSIAEEFSNKNNSDVSFSVKKPKIYFSHNQSEHAKLINFHFSPPAKKMFVDSSSNISLFPALYFGKKYFLKLNDRPNFIPPSKSNLTFSYYKLGKSFLKIDSRYSLYSAKTHGDLLYISAVDKNGNFISLNQNHISLYDNGGAKIRVSPISSPTKNISLLVDRSGSMDGFDTEMKQAIKQFSLLPILKYYCGIYEFGDGVKTIQRPYVKTGGFNNEVQRTQI